MPSRSGRTKLYRLLMTGLVAIAPALSLAACQRETDTAAPAARPVRTTTVEKREAGEALTFTGRIEAEDEVSVAFRISGRLLENSGKLGDRVQAGQIIARLARKDGRDAVFDIPAQLLRSAPSNPQITVSLTDDPAVTAPGRIREVAAQANPVTRTFEVKVGLTEPPPAMRLGATVVGRMQTDAVPIIDIPATALTKINQRPAVWIVDPSTKTVSIRNVDVLR